MLCNDRVQESLPSRRLRVRGSRLLTALLMAFPDWNSREAFTAKAANPISYTAVRFQVVFQIMFPGEIGIAAVDGTFESGRVRTSRSTGFDGVERRYLLLRLLAKDLEDLIAIKEATVVFYPGTTHQLWVLLEIRVFGN